ncbi:uncharacterized [Tachysurus ichikawai]
MQSSALPRSHWAPRPRRWMGLMGLTSLSAAPRHEGREWRNKSSLLVDAVKKCEREQSLRVGPCPGSPALLDPHHLPQLLLPFKCHSD